MTYRQYLLIPRRLSLAIVASIALHLLLVLMPIFGKPQTNSISTKLQLATKIMHVSLSRREPATNELSPSPANSVAIRMGIAPTTPMAMVLSRQPALIEGTVDDVVDNSDGMAIHGDLLLQIFLDRLGRPTSVRVIKSSMRRDVEGSVVQRFFRAKYQPGEVNGLPVSSDIILSISLTAKPER